MRTNRELSRAVRRALATGTLALFAAGTLVAHAQTSAQKTSAQQKSTHPANKHGQSITPQLLAQNVPASAPAGGAQTLQEIVITGSLIESTTVETPNPVQILTTKDLIQSGYTNISDVLRNIPANGMGTLSQSFSFAFASGGAGVALRGLTLGDTLTLIDGEQSVPYPLLDDVEREFVDVNSIPFTAVQQVQILKDGGSALYGSNAIAGVVNVILRKQYQGFTVSATSGTSQHWDGTTTQLGFIGGHGDLASDGYNWYLSGDFRHQDQILDTSRSGSWRTLNFTPWGGYNVTPGANPAEDPNNAVAQSLTGYLIDPNTSSGLPYSFYPGCSALAQQLDQCTFLGARSQLQPSDTNVDLLGKFTKALGDSWEFGLQASWFDSRTDQVAGYPELGTLNYPYGTTLIGLSPYHAPDVVTYPVITVPANYPGNPYGAPAPLVYSVPEVGQSETLVNTNTYRLLASLSGTAAGWKIKGTVGAMYAKMALTYTGDIAPGALQTALDNGYLLGSPLGTSLFAPPEESTPTSNMDLVDIHGTHKLFQMPGGPLNLAVGVQWIKEGNDYIPPPVIQDAIQGGNDAFDRGNEYDRAGFAELQGNPIKQLDLDAQARYDNYQTFGSRVSPNFGVKFTPWNWIALRGTWGQGFRVPSPSEGISSGFSFGEGTIQDPVLCPTAVPGGKVAGPGDFAATCAWAATGVLSANPHLKDVTSTNWTAGIILQPIQPLSASVDYYNIKVNNDIVGAVSLSSSNQLLRGPDVPLDYCPGSFAGGCTESQLVTATTPVGTIVEEAFPYVNASATHVSGFDVDLKYDWDWGRFGSFTGDAQWTHELTYQLALGGTTYELAGTHGPTNVSGDTGNPKDRFTARLSWRKGPLTVTPSADFIGHFSIIDPSAGFNTCGDSLAYIGNFPGGSVPANESQFCTVGYFLETNLYASYQLTGSLEVHASATNLFNKQPPMDVTTYGAGSYFYPYDAAFAQDGAVGRFMSLGITYNF
ncbi:MAG: TonB-dependent receptor [Steroidobacteraceae bacterium]